MASSLVFSNGEMFVGLDEHAQVISLYFPHVGSEQHTAFPRLAHKIGVWVDGRMSWLDSGEWRFSFHYQPQSLVGDIRATHDQLQISLELSDAVARSQNAWLRNIHVVNNADHERDIRLFLHQAFHIGQSSIAETAYYSPDDAAIVHYKGRRVFFVGAASSQRATFDQYSMGKSDGQTHEGTWRDAEDGELGGNTVQMGSVDSAIRLKLTIPGMSSDRAYYWVAAGKSQREARTVHEQVLQAGVQSLQLSTALWWRDWLRPVDKLSDRLSAKNFLALEKALMIIKAHCDKRGAVLASLDISPLAFTDDAYAYTWARDAAYTLWPLIRLGYRDEARRYFEFVKNILHPDGYVSHKHTADGALGPSWHSFASGEKTRLPIQTDETASVLFLFAQYIERFDDKRYLSDSYYGFVAPMANFLAQYTYDDGLPQPSYDIWEQMYMTSAYTTSVTYGALRSAAKLARRFGRDLDAQDWDGAADAMQVASKVFMNDKTGYPHRGFYTGPNDVRHLDDTPDISSFYGLFMYGLMQPGDSETKRALKTMQRVLQSHAGSDTYIRFVGDDYRSVDGATNIWIVPTLWVAQIMIEIDDMMPAARAIDWTLALETWNPFIPEQVDPQTQESTLISPLVWSHAELISTLLDYMSNPSEEA